MCILSSRGVNQSISYYLSVSSLAKCVRLSRCSVLAYMAMKNHVVLDKNIFPTPNSPIQVIHSCLHMPNHKQVIYGLMYPAGASSKELFTPLDDGVVRLSTLGCFLLCHSTWSFSCLSFCWDVSILLGWTFRRFCVYIALMRRPSQ